MIHAGYEISDFFIHDSNVRAIFPGLLSKTDHIPAVFSKHST